MQVINVQAEKVDSKQLGALSAQGPNPNEVRQGLRWAKSFSLMAEKCIDHCTRRNQIFTFLIAFRREDGCELKHRRRWRIVLLDKCRGQCYVTSICNA